MELAAKPRKSSVFYFLGAVMLLLQACHVPRTSDSLKPATCKEISTALDRLLAGEKIDSADVSDVLRMFDNTSDECLCQSNTRLSDLWWKLPRIWDPANSIEDHVHYTLLDKFGISVRGKCSHRGYTESAFFVIEVRQTKQSVKREELYVGNPRYTITVDCSPDTNASSVLELDSKSMVIMTSIRADHRIYVPWPRGFCMGPSRRFAVRGSIDVENSQSYSWSSQKEHSTDRPDYKVPNTDSNRGTTVIVSLRDIPRPRL